MTLGTLSSHLSDSAATWLSSALRAIGSSPDSIGAYFASASRRCGRTPWNVDDPDGYRFGLLDDLARTAMLAALPNHRADVVTIVSDLYRYGDANEKRGVLRGAHVLDANLVGDSLLPLVDDALRTNDARIIAAAVQRYGATRLNGEAFRHAVVKCVFVGIPLDCVVGLTERTDAELARMLVDLAHERFAAGRAIPTDIPPLVAAFPVSLTRSDLPSEFLEHLSLLAAGGSTDTTTTVQEN